MTWATSHRDDCASSSHVARARSRCADAWSEHAACAPRLRRPGPRYSGALTKPAARALTVVQHRASLEVPASAVRDKDAPSDDSVRVAPTARSAQGSPFARNSGQTVEDAWRTNRTRRPSPPRPLPAFLETARRSSAAFGRDTAVALAGVEGSPSDARTLNARFVAAHALPHAFAQLVGQQSRRL